LKANVVTAWQICRFAAIRQDFDERLGVDRAQGTRPDRDKAVKRSNSTNASQATMAHSANLTIEGSTIRGSVQTGSTTTNEVHRGRRPQRPTAYPDGAIGSNLLQRNYIRYLVEHYHRFREADASFGREPARFSYAVIFRNIERKFKAPTYFIPQVRFNELGEYLKHRIDRTILGQRNRARGIHNYASFEQYAAEQQGRAGESR